MRRDELFDVLGQIDDRFIIPARRIRWSFPWQHYVGVAAALGVIVTGIWALAHMGRYGGGLLPAYPTDPTPSATTAPTDESTEPTQPSTEATTPSTAPTEPAPTQEATTPEELQQYIEDWEAYCARPYKFIIIPGYDPDVTYDYEGKDFDESGMVAGSYYAIDDGEVYYLTDQHLGVTEITAEHIYYVMSSDPSAIYRCTLHGEDHMLIYRSEYAEINQAHYNGTDSNGQLVLSERGENQQIIALDIQTGEIRVLLTPENRVGFFYRPHSLDYTEQNKGPILEVIYRKENGQNVTEIYLIDSGRYLQQSEKKYVSSKGG